jgi:hypothetical protein
MKREELTRRDFHRLTAAAMGGLVAGTIAGCGGEDEPAPGNGGAQHSGQPPAGHDAAGGHEAAGAAGGDGAKYDVSLLLEEPHVCRGLNTCMNKGASGENACAGQGTCATAEHHTCHQANACKGQGGCGDYPGQNTCKMQSECGVPLSEGTWEKARAAFEKIWKERNPDKELGMAPAA